MDTVEQGLDGSDSGVPKAAAQRLTNQIARAYRGTFGARSGLRTVVRLIAGQMLRAGSSPEAVSRALTRYVANESKRLASEPESVAAAAFDVRILIELTAQCVADVAREVSPAPRENSRRV